MDSDYKQVLKAKIQKKEACIGVIGLGMIGLSFVQLFAEVGFTLVGYDRNSKKIESLKQKKFSAYGTDFDAALLSSLIDSNQFKPSHDPEILRDADILIISINTSLDLHHVPDLSSLYEGFELVVDLMHEGQLMILQSTTYPGTTEEYFLPALEKNGKKAGKQFFLGYVPEMINLGEKSKFSSTPRIISGVTRHCAELIYDLYQKTACPIYKAPSPKVAEGAKLLQNTFRLINISFINEMKMMFDGMGINIWEVIEAASQKPYGFMAFQPGPGIGGDCVPVDPLYLIWKADEYEGHTEMLELARHINDEMPRYVMKKIIYGLSTQNHSIQNASILLLGVCYKKNVNLITNSAALKIISLAKKEKAKVFYHDPFIFTVSSSPNNWRLNSIEMDYSKLKDFDAVVILTDHSCYDWKRIAENSRLIIDTQNAMKNIKNLKKRIIRA